MKTNLRMKCPSCGHWNRVLANKIFIEPDSPEPKVKVLIPMYEPLQISKCKKCGNVIAEPKELIRITKSPEKPAVKALLDEESLTFGDK